MGFTPLDASTTTQAPSTSGFVPLDQVAGTSAPTAAPAPAPAQPGFFSQLASSFFSGFSTGTDIISPAKQYQAGQAQIDQPFIDKAAAPTGGFTPLDAAEGALSVGSGLVTKLSAPLAPIFGPLSKAIEFIGNLDEKIASKAQPGLEEWASSPQGAQTIRAVNDLNNAANVLQVAVGGVEGIKALGRGEVPTKPIVGAEIAPKEAPVAQQEPITEVQAPKPTEPTPAPVRAPVAPKPEVPPALIDNLKAEIAAREDALANSPAQGLRKYYGSNDPQFSNLDDIFSRNVGKARSGELDSIVQEHGFSDVQDAHDAVLADIVEKERIDGLKAELKRVQQGGTQTSSPLKTQPGVSRIGKSIEVKAVEEGLSRGFDKTAGYDPVTIKEQAQKATELINNNIEQARAIIRGDEPLPKDLKGTALITAAEEYIKTTRDADLAHELANSPLVSATSQAAQELRLAAERVPDSITAKFQEIKRAREAAAEKRGGVKKAVKQLTQDVQKEIKRSASTRQTWEAFAKTISCNY